LAPGGGPPEDELDEALVEDVVDEEAVDEDEEAVEEEVALEPPEPLLPLVVDDAAPPAPALVEVVLPEAVSPPHAARPIKMSGIARKSDILIIDVGEANRFAGAASRTLGPATRRPPGRGRPRPEQGFFLCPHEHERARGERLPPCQERDQRLIAGVARDLLLGLLEGPLDLLRRRARREVLQL